MLESSALSEMPLRVPVPGIVLVVLLLEILELPAGLVVFIVILLLWMKAPLHFIRPAAIIAQVFGTRTGTAQGAGCPRDGLYVGILDRREERGLQARTGRRSARGMDFREKGLKKASRNIFENLRDPSKYIVFLEDHSGIIRTGRSREKTGEADR